jgi:hypothetical protein
MNDGQRYMYDWNQRISDIIEELADRLSDYQVYTSYENNTPIGSNDLERMKEETINAMGEILKEIIEGKK